MAGCDSALPVTVPSVVVALVVRGPVVVAVVVVAVVVVVLAREAGDGEGPRARREVGVDHKVGVVVAGDRRRALQERARACAVKRRRGRTVAELDERELCRRPL